MQRVLLLFVGLTGCSLVASLDDYDFVAEKETDGSCECTDDSLACCDGCHFTKAGEGEACAQTEQFKCSHTNCGGVIERRGGEQLCSGNSPTCDGDVAWGKWEVHKECGDFALCLMEKEGSGAHCLGDLKCANWIRIEGDSFDMGSDFPKESPKHPVTIRSFDMMQTEVTVGMYRACEKNGICSPSSEEDGCNFIMADFENHPMNCVSWDQANVFCAWAGARLSSESEWEYAARSNGQNFLYPWGNERASCEFAVINEGGDGCGTGATFPVCSKPEGNTATDLCDMGGNLWEWVDDMWHDNYEGAPDDGTSWGDPPHEDRTIRGGGLFSPGDDTQVSRREQEPGKDQYADVGFRCARGSNAGAVCESDNDCLVDAICPSIFGNEIESSCYVDCTKDPQICDGTNFPFCTTAWSYNLCLDQITLKGRFSCRVNNNVKQGNDAVLVIGKDGKENTLIECSARKSQTGEWLMQLIGFVDGFQRDALIYWDPALHQTTETIPIEKGFVFDDKFDSQNNLIEENPLGFFLSGSGTIQLDEAGTESGEKVSGTIELVGREYRARNEP